MRVIAQRVETRRDPSLYRDDERGLDERDTLRPTDRSLFVKVSYAFQR